MKEKINRFANWIGWHPHLVIIEILIVVAAAILVSLPKIIVTEVKETSFNVYLPRIDHDCSWLVRHQEYVNAVVACEARLEEERRQNGLVRMPGDCEVPEPQDYCVP